VLDKNALTRSFLSFDPNAELISCSVTDPAWLNATFSLVALYYDLSLGKELSLECLFHRGEALRLVNQRLAGGSGQSIDQSTIGAVALLANFDVRFNPISFRCQPILTYACIDYYWIIEQCGNTYEWARAASKSAGRFTCPQELTLAKSGYLVS
jgi:hypothetical protein